MSDGIDCILLNTHFSTTFGGLSKCGAFSAISATPVKSQPTNSVWHAAHKALLWRFKVFHIAIIVNQQPANCSSGPRHKQTNYNHN